MTTTSTKPMTVHCWLREQREDGSLHRVGCVALKRTAKGVMSAFTLCSPGDKFDGAIIWTTEFGPKLDIVTIVLLIFKLS